MSIRNILICTTQVPFTTGGAESHVGGLRRALIESGYNTEIVALPFKWYPPGEILRGAMAWRMLDLTEANGKPVDLVIGMRFPAYIVEHTNKVLWIMHQHRSAYNLIGSEFDDLSTYPDGGQVRAAIHHMDNEFIPKAKKVFANSRTVADRLLKFNRIESEPLYHPPPRFDRLKGAEIGDYIFCPSRLEPQKRQELLIEAMKDVKSPIKAVFAGSMRDESHYRSLVRAHGVEDRIEFRGFADDAAMIDLYANALGVCYLPFDEDYGYVTIEAMAAARPVIVPVDGGGATEFVDNAAEGFVVEPNAYSISEAINALASDRRRAKAMGIRGKERIVALNLSWKHVVEKIIQAAE